MLKKILFTFFSYKSHYCTLFFPGLVCSHSSSALFLYFFLSLLLCLVLCLVSLSLALIKKKLHFILYVFKILN